MRRRRAWQIETSIALSFGTGAIFLGLVFGHVQWWLVLALALYTIRLVVEVARVARWLEERATHYPPDSSGISGLIGQVAFAHFKNYDEEFERLSALMEEFTRSAQALPDSIVILDARHHIRWCNSAATRSLGISADGDAGQPLENLVRHPTFVRYLREGNFSESLTLPAPSNPELVLSVHIVPYGSNQHVLVARDITESVRVEKMRRDFISNVSHELRTPITILKGHIERLLSPTPPAGDRLMHSFSVMEVQTNRLADVVEDLLLLSRVESVDRAPDEQLVDMQSLMAEIREEVEVLSEQKKHTFVCECDAQLRIWGDYQELRTAFSNLVRNAVQYAPGGEIAIRWHATPNGAVFSVRDAGTGIAPEHLPRLTERFYRVDNGRSRDTGGTGLGLAIVKHVLNHYGARLEIESTLGVGSTFRCHFPSEIINADPNVVPLAVG